MEILLAIVVASAVIFFGALISMGNERQRRAIDGLREQVVLWAVQDLKIKRKHLEQTIQVPDPLGWLNNISSNICGHDLKLQIIESMDEPQSLICASADNQYKIVFTSLSPLEIRDIRKNKHSRLGRFPGQNELLSLPKDVASHELSALNIGILFDLELELVWMQVTGKKLRPTNSFWMYEYS